MSALKLRHDADIVQSIFLVGRKNNLTVFLHNEVRLFWEKWNVHNARPFEFKARVITC